ncbi:uncharacterized protein LOC121725425 [Aricia agestis]|uniref:uncharacterized protein LOC121725425 n=1 Tax=Aricia agestis TaxID=91739 RepID=UPI001C209571|nr:uncharacterized protein LOC121725425 [Aricia agestis]
MARTCLMLLALVSISVTAECNLIHGVALKGFKTKEVLVPHDHEEAVEVVSNVVDAPVDEILTSETDVVTRDTTGTTLDKKCAAVGEFCMYHSECCTNACLGYLKRCVT